MSFFIPPQHFQPQRRASQQSTTGSAPRLSVSGSPGSRASVSVSSPLSNRRSLSSDTSSIVNVPSASSATPGSPTTPGPRSTSSSQEYDFVTATNTSPMTRTVPISPKSSTRFTSSSTSSSSYRLPTGKARLLYCKSHVSIHPTAFSKDNISGYLGIVEIDKEAGFDGERLQDRKESLVTWVPNELLDRMDERDREGYRRADGRPFSRTWSGDKEDDGFVLVSLPPPKGEKYAFSVPVSNIYSILVYAPSLTHWYGSATFNLSGGVSLPTLFFHDDESPMLASSSTKPGAPPATPVPRSQWGFPPFLNLLQSRATMLRSRLFTPKQNQGAELWLVNPSKADREVHEAGVEEPSPPDRRHSSAPSNQPTSMAPYPPKPSLPSNPFAGNEPPRRQSIMTSFSNITNFTRKAAKEVLNHPLAQPVVPILPPAVRSLVNANGEWDKGGKKAKNNDVVSEFESARLYLARWARVVAEEGERARKTELAAQAYFSAGERVGADELASSLGVFSLLTSPNSKKPIPHPTRSPDHPITIGDWESFAAQGRDEGYIRKEIFRRGFSDSSEPEARETRKEGWEVLLGVVEWSEGGLGGGSLGKENRKKGREDAREKKREEYLKLKEKWVNESSETQRNAWKEEWHRIDVDCRRTDRNQKLFAVPEEAVQKGDEEKEAGGAGSGWDKKTENEEGGMARLNPHIAALRNVLMTYHTYAPELGYVQGMSDLLSPIYVVFDANEADSFWGLVGLMKMMESNFLRDQSGMKRQLSTLQQLIGVMDPELYAHLERTDSLNLFFCFRWILISFKREFKFESVIKLWEVLWTNYYSNQFVLFVALAILQSHRDVILRYLTQFDEVLKYANDLSGSIDLDTTLAQAEVLFLCFRGLVEDLDRRRASEDENSGGSGLRKRRGSAVSVRSENGKIGRDVGELRDLLVAWPDETPLEDRVGQYDVQLRRVSHLSGFGSTAGSSDRRGSVLSVGSTFAGTGTGTGSDSRRASAVGDFRSGVWSAGTATPSVSGDGTSSAGGERGVGEGRRGSLSPTAPVASTTAPADRRGSFLAELAKSMVSPTAPL